MNTSEQAHKHTAHVAYDTRTLYLYDVLLRMIPGLCWGCSVDKLVDFYSEHISGNHLDVGVGSGYFLDRCRIKSEAPRLALMDSNPDPLEFAAARLRRYEPLKVVANILQPIQFKGEKFDSVGLNYVVHCLPGPMSKKGLAMENLKALMNDGAVLFGSTVLGQGVEHSFLGSFVLKRMNGKGIIDNYQDSAAALKAMLDEQFAESSVQVVGRTALFTARHRAR